MFHQYTVKLQDTNNAQIQSELASEDIPVAIYYPTPVHLQPAYTSLGYSEGNFPVSEKLSKTVLSLPMHTELSAAQQEHIVDRLKATITNGRLVVVGTGYVGIVTGTCLAESGNRVICVDIDKDKIAMMERGKVQSMKPHLESLLIRNIEAERISFTTDLASAVKASPIVFLALPTPPGEDGSADLQYVLNVADELGDYC